MIVQPIVKIGPARDKDPTRTITLRKQWIAEINSRYGKLKKAITEYVVEQNTLGGHEKAAEPPHEIAVMYDPNQPRVPKGNPAGGQWTKVGGGGSVPGPRTSDEVSDRASLESFADASLPRDTETHEYFYHAARWDSDIDSIAEHGLDPKKTPGGAFYASKDEIRDRGSGFVIFKAPRGEGEEGTDVVEEGLSYREWVFTSRVPPQDVVKVVRVVTDKEGFRIREDDLAKHILSGKLTKDEFLSLPEKYQKWVVLSPLSTNSLAVLAAPKYVYEDSAAKIDGFMGWLDQQVQSGILVSARREGGVVGYGNRLWSDVFIESAYQRGIAQARADLNGVGVDLPDMGPVSTAFNRPFHADRVALLYTRAFNGMKGVTEAMKSQMSDVLAQGMAEGRSPYDIAYKLRDRVDKIGITRSRLIARTEVVRAHNVAALNEFEALENLVGEEIWVQWWTAKDERVRPHHAIRHGQRYKRSTALGMIGEPNCRCALLPWTKTISDIKAKKLKDIKALVVPLEPWNDATKLHTFLPDQKNDLIGKTLNGVPFDNGSPLDWGKFPDSNIAEPKMVLKSGKHASAGCIIVEQDDRVWLVEPKNHFGGYEHTFPKGSQSSNLTLQQTALKETWEESGLHVNITGHLGDYEKSTSITRYYIAERTGGNPAAFGIESQSVKLVPESMVPSLLNKAVDKDVFSDLVLKLEGKQTSWEAKVLKDSAEKWLVSKKVTG